MVLKTVQYSFPVKAMNYQYKYTDIYNTDRRVEHKKGKPNNLTGCETIPLPHPCQPARCRPRVSTGCFL